MRRGLAGLIVLLSAASAAAVDSHTFFIEVTNNNTCMGVEFSIGGETYAITRTPGRQMLGPTRREFSGATMVPATLKWYERTLSGGSSCAGPTPASRVLVVSSASHSLLRTSATSDTERVGLPRARPQRGAAGVLANLRPQGVPRGSQRLMRRPRCSPAACARSAICHTAASWYTPSGTFSGSQ